MVSQSFRSLMDAVYRGDQEAARILFEEYGDLLLRVVRRHLNPLLRAQADSTDFIQETWLAFLKDVPKERTFDSPAQLASFLAVMARNKVVDAVRRGLILERNNINREVSLQAHSLIRESLPSPQSTPSQACVRRELEHHLLQGLRPAHQCIARKLLDGRTPQVIAEELQVSVRTVERVRDRILEQLQPS